MRITKPFIGVVAACAVAGAASPATASADLSLKRAEREAVRVVAPSQATSAFCVRPSRIGTKGRNDKAFCVVQLVAPPGTKCTALVFVQRRATLSGARVTARKLNEAVGFPAPVPLSESDL